MPSVLLLRTTSTAHCAPSHVQSSPSTTHNQHPYQRARILGHRRNFRPLILSDTDIAMLSGTPLYSSGTPPPHDNIAARVRVWISKNKDITYLDNNSKDYLQAQLNDWVSGRKWFLTNLDLDYLSKAEKFKLDSLEKMRRLCTQVEGRQIRDEDFDSCQEIERQYYKRLKWHKKMIQVHQGDQQVKCPELRGHPDMDFQRVKTFRKLADGFFF